MKLTVLGKYGPFPKLNGGTSSYLLQTKGKNILIDAGEGSFSRLGAFVAPEELDAVILTHSHYDHVCDIGVYNYYFEMLSKSGKSFNKPIIALQDDGNPSTAPAFSSPYFEKIITKDGFGFNIGDISLSFISVNHPVPCLAVKINDGERTFAFTGDTNLSENLDALAKGSDLLLADGAFLHRDWSASKPHLSVKLVSELSKKWGVKSIITHLSPLYDEREIAAEAQLGGGDCVIAREATTYEV